MTRKSSCSCPRCATVAHQGMQDMHSLTTSSINASQSTRPALDLMLRNALTPAYSKSLGPSPAVWRPQPGRPRSLCRLFHPLPHPQSEAAEVCHTVRSRLSTSYTPPIPSAGRFLDLARTPPLACLVLPRFPSLVSSRLSSMRSSHVAAARRWCAYSRIHGIIDVLVAMPGRARHAMIRRRTLRALGWPA